jgi:anti-sigma B factor antagonist
MELIISERKEGNSLILDLDGDLILGESNKKLRSSVRDSIEAGYKKIVIEMSDVQHLDSSGIGELISSLTAVSRSDGTLVLLNPTDRAHKLLAISQLTDIFEIKRDH